MLEIITVQAYTLEIASGIGKLMPQLHPDVSSDPVARQKLEKIIFSDEKDQLIAMQGELIAGTCMVADISELNWSAGYLGGMVVDSAVRGQGIGSALLESAFDWCRDRGIERIGWYSEDDEFHAAAHRMYKRHGSVIIAPFFEKELPK